MRLGVGIKTQVPSVMNGLTVEENLWLSARRVSGREETQAAVADVLGQMSLEPIARRLVGELAHGQRQLVEIGLVLSQRPWLLLLDEPAAGITGVEADQLVRIIHEVNRKATIVVVDHDMQFVRMLGGRVTVESALRQGSTFTVTLPDHGRALPAAAEAILKGAEHAPLVMVVDDDPNARGLLGATVRREGYRVIEATDGESALGLAREWHPDIVTLDVLMPRMDGWAVLTALKSDPELVQIPVVIVTVLADRGIAVSLGAAEFLTKPVDRARLAATLRQHVYGSGVVLVVDDEAESRGLARRHLVRLGWEVAEATDGGSALSWLSQNPRPAMILLDLLMPGMNGFGFLEEIAKHEEWRDIPIVILTAMPLGAAERELLAGRTREVIAKGADDLAQVLRRILVRLPKATEIATAAG